jgi:acylphosphatase
MKANVMESRIFWASGRVQGVYYRAFVRQHARRLGIRGYAKNLADGRVEVLASGEPAVMDEFRGYLHMGPPGSDVRHVEERGAAAGADEGFEIR